MASSSTDKAALQILRTHPDVHTVFYNTGIQASQVKNETLYKKWILVRLRKDLVAAICKHKADIIALCELGEITIGLGNTLAGWKKSNSTKKEKCANLVEDMLLEVVDTEEVRARNPAGFSVHAVEHYGLLVANDFVRIVDKPTLVGPMCSHQAYRKAQRFSFVPVSSSDENPAKPVELWNIHCSSSNNYPYGPLAREQVPAFCQKHGGERVIWGGDLNSSVVFLEDHKAKKNPWKVHHPGNAKHGDIVLSRGVSVDLMHICIGGGEEIGMQRVHVMVGLVLHPECADNAGKCFFQMLTAFQPMLRANHETETRKEACQTQNISAEKPDKITLLPNPEVVDEVVDEAVDEVVDEAVDEVFDEADYGEAEDAHDESVHLADFAEAEDVEDAQSVITNLAKELDAEEGPPENADDVTQLIRFLWFGAEFDEGCCDAYDRGQKRLANIMSHVRWARWKFAGVTSATQILRPTQVEQVHNEYRDSNMWMPDDVWKKWKRLRDSKKKGSNQDAHQHRRKTFNVFLFKLSGSKALFFHFIKVGTERININALLTAWSTFKTGEEYNKMLARSTEKSAKEKEIKSKRDRIRADLKIMQQRVNKRHRPEDVKSMHTLVQQLQEAKREYAKTGRAGRSSSVASFLPDA